MSFFLCVLLFPRGLPTSDRLLCCGPIGAADQQQQANSNKQTNRTNKLTTHKTKHTTSNKQTTNKTTKKAATQLPPPHLTFAQVSLSSLSLSLHLPPPLLPPPGHVELAVVAHQRPTNKRRLVCKLGALRWGVGWAEQSLATTSKSSKSAG